MKNPSYRKQCLAGLISACLALGVAATALTLTGCAGTGSRESTGEYIDDAAITAKVKTRMARDPVVSAMQVSVETFKSVVQLSGFVDTAEQKERAAQIAAGVNGVKDVRNNITVKTR